MNSNLEVETIFSLLKAHLKLKRISYKELAKKLKMSESNTKRIFSVRSVSLHLLIRICSVLDISLSELVGSASKSSIQSFQINNDAIEFFIKNFDTFILFRSLSAAKDIDQFIKNSNTPTAKIEVQLRQLIELNLIKKKRASYQIINSGYLDLSNAPELVNKLYQKWVPWFFQRVLANQKNENYLLETFSTGLSKTNQSKLFGEITQLIARYKEIGSSDQRIGSSNFESIGLCIGIGPHRVGLFEDDELLLPKKQ